MKKETRTEKEARESVERLARYPHAITLAEFLQMRGNSDFWEKVYPRLDDEALAHAIRHTLGNCSQADGYPGLLQRLAKLGAGRLAKLAVERR